MNNKLYIITAPSGAGKTSLVSACIERTPNLARAVSHTTRKPRKGEQEGVAYYFVDDAGFDKLQMDLFARTKYYGNKYGTTTTEVDRLLPDHNVVLIMDYQGALQSKQTYPEATTIFILPDSKDTLRERLKERGDMTDEDIEHRLSRYYEEISSAKEYDWMLLNEDFEEAVNNLKGIIDDGG